MLSLALYIYTVAHLPTCSLSHTIIISLLFSNNFSKLSDIYKRLRQFDYGQPNCTTDNITTCIHENNNWTYIGELKKGTDDIPHGIGIKVYRCGNICEGYWKDGKLHGRGRGIKIDIINKESAFILRSEKYYIGDYKKGRMDGNGTEYYENGDKYEGEWKDGEHYGLGTYYRWNGDKYTGKQDGDKGQGKIEYTDGTKYTGHWNRLYERHGLGTLYSADGQVLNQGKWEEDNYKGKE